MAKQSILHKYPEIWGGIECTINRCNDTFKDQLKLSNHYNRKGDLEAFAALGIKALRYPILWEKHCPDERGNIDWDWVAGQLNTLNKLNIVPIAGLVHHGSGPSFTSLYDNDFPQQLAAHAKNVATRFPWLEYYTPVNEPLTTARFSGLYGFWYPHHTSDHSFLTMLLNQVEGIVLSMKAVREINPVAKLVQTEDIGKTHATPRLKYQAHFENYRRWLTYDLLCGKIDPAHPMWNYFIDNGIAAERLLSFTRDFCVPDIMGLNYYVTSERYLDERVDRFPGCNAGSNGKHDYVDTEAVRHIKPAGLQNILSEAWKRYNLPLVITEAHLHSTREDQMRWFKETWDICCTAIKKGINVKAITAWSLLGAYDWDSLVVNNDRHYEVGVYDIRRDTLRPTAMVKMIQSLSAQASYDHPVLQNKGWWYRHNPVTRLIVPPKPVRTSRPLLIIGKNGTLGNAFKIICEHRGIDAVSLTRQDIDITSTERIEEVIDAIKPWGVVNATGYVKVDNAETELSECFAVNGIAPGLISAYCKKLGIPFMHFSSDMVFSGDKHSPYLETDNVMPVNIYGKSKLLGETAITKTNSEALIIRTSAFFGPWDKYNFVYNIISSLKGQHYCDVVEEITISPTYIPDLVNASLDLFIDEEKGIWHVSNGDGISWVDFAEQVADRCGHSKKEIHLKNSSEMNWTAKRPSYSVLGSARGIRLPRLNNAIERYFNEAAIVK